MYVIKSVPGVNHISLIYNLDVIKAVQEAYAKNTEQLRKEAEDKKWLERLEKEQLGGEKQTSLEVEQAEKRKDMLEKKEGELRSDEVKFEKEYDITMRMLKSVHAQVDAAIANNDMVGINVPRDLIEVATKKLKTTLKYWEQQSKVRVDIEKIQKIALNKLFRTAKKTNNCDWRFF